MQTTYISDYIPSKLAVSKELAFNETNIEDIIANVEDYQKLLEEFQSTNQGYFDKKADILVNKDIDRLKSEMRLKLDQFRKDNYIGTSFYNSFKLDNKLSSSYDESIKKMADEIIKVVNSQNIIKNIDSIGNKKKK